MTILKAVHQIVRGVSGKREVLDPGDVFETEGDEATYLLRIGAAIKTGEAPRAAKPGKTGEQDPDTKNPGKSIDDMTVNELLAEADARGIEIPEGVTKKADIKAVIEDAEEDII